MCRPIRGLHHPRRILVKLRTGAVVAASAALALALAGCQGATPSTPGPAAKAAFNDATTKVVNASTAKGGTLKLATDADADSWDPARTYYAWMWNFSRYYNRTLLTPAAAVGKDGLVLQPDLAQALPEVSADGLTYTFKLKSGIKFEDGTPITSKDIKYGIERIFAQDILPGGPTYLIEQLDQGQGYKGPYKDSDPAKLGLKSVQTPDDSTIVFTLKSPFADLSYLLAMPGSGPVPQAKDTGDKYGSKPVASGPYKMADYQPGKSVKFVRNENWDPATDSVRKALPDEIDLAIIADDNEIDNQLLDGTLHLNVDQVGVQAAAQAKILLDPALKANADEPLTGFTRYFGISTTVKPFDKLECRQAVQWAADKVALQTARGGKDAGGDVATHMIPPTVAGFDPNYQSKFTGPDGKPNVDEAKKALAACGQPNGFKTVIATQSTEKGKKVAEALQQALKAVGIDATIDATDPAPYYSATIGTPANVAKKGYGLMVAGWGADFPSGFGFLDVIVDGTKIQPAGGNTNIAELNDPAINAKIVEANKMTDPAAAAKAWGEIDSMVMDTATYLPFVWDKALNWRSDKLTNVYYNSYYGMVDFCSLGLSS
jgi:peptide/nickel transport system substrate-binding protein